MKKLLLLIAFMMPMMLFGQSYTELWKKVEAAREKDLPQTEMEVLRKISEKAEKEMAYGQLLKAKLEEASAQCNISNDSLNPAVERLKLCEEKAQDEVLQAVYDVVLGYIYEHNRALDEQHKEIAADYYAKALLHPEKLAAVKADAFAPLVINERDSKIYDDDMLSVIAYEVRRFDVLRDYYVKAGQNRKAMLMASLEQLRSERPNEMVSIKNSTYLQRIDSLIAIYGDLDEAGELAIERYHYMDDYTTATLQQKWDYLNEAIQQWSSWPRINALKNARSQMKSLQFSVHLDKKVILPNLSQKVELSSLRGVDALTMRVFRVNTTARHLAELRDKKDDFYKAIKNMLTPLPEFTQERTYSGKAPYEMYSDSMTLGALPVGIYMLEFESSPASSETERVICYVSDLHLLAQSLPDQQIRYVVVNATTGQPVKGAQLLLKFSKNTTTLTTDANGECIFVYKDNRPSSIYVTTDDDKACPSTSLYGRFSFYDSDRTYTHTQIFTDRAIYRPGQTVHMSAILYETEDGYKNRVLKGKEVTVRLRDANYKIVEEKDLTTDEFGTCATDFVLPRQGLSGNFRIDVDREGLYIRVEEYKRPTFEVEIPTVKENYAEGDTLQVKGTARSYAGVPVQGAKVNYKVERRRAFWWFSYYSYWNQGVIGEGSETQLLASGEVETDGDGTFTMSVPMIIPKSRYPMFYNIIVTAEVTDQAGETHHGELSLPLGNRKTAFTMDVPEKVLAEEGGSVTFHQRNAAGTDLEAQVRYRFDNGKWQTAKTQTAVTIPAAQLKSGRHTLEGVCAGDTLKREFIIFSLNDKRPAIETPDWFYVSDSRFPNNGKPVTLQVGSSDKNVHIVYTVIADDEVLESGFVDKSDELINRKLTYKEEYGNGVLLNFAWVKNGKTYTHQTTISRPLPDTNLRMKWTTFRDRLTPGQKEEWTLNIMAPTGKAGETAPAKAQLLATLYDKSLDQLVSHSWSLSPYIWLPTPSTSWNFPSWGSQSCTGTMWEKTFSVRDLRFSHFDHDIYPSSYIAYGYGRPDRMFMVRKSAVGAMSGDMMVVEEAMADEAPLAEPTGLANTNAVEKEAESSSDAGQQESVQVRENLSETAFFFPQLTTDSLGNVAIKFTLPESLTTWRFLSVAHTQDMMTGVLTDEAVAKKDVMIQPNMPRFIRTGDHAQISARIFNTGEKSVSGKARLELIDPETEKMIFAEECPLTLAKDSTTAVTFNYNCGQDTPSLLIAKMMVSGENFSDGEQHYLSILPDREHVTVTVPFTQVEPGLKVIDLKGIMAQHDPNSSVVNSKLTVEYTNNPAWLMIQALPTIGHPHDNCAICQATSYYANTIGRHILAQNPNAKHVFEQWSREKGAETTLMSSLQKNEELKDLVLSETPWVNDASREQEQKEKLSDFFDENLMQQRLSSSVEKVRNLQRSDGSWSWWPDMPGSWYMTVEITEMLVRLNEMTGQQAETQKMLSQAFKYLGKEVVELVNEMKKEEKKGHKQYFHSHKCLQWLYFCAIDGRELPTKVQDANAYLIKLLKKETRNQSIFDKAMTAIVLNDKTYIKSLKEYTVYREDMGRYYDTPRALYSWRDYRIPTQVAAIEAFKRLTPEDTMTIVEMQRWLLQEKRTQVWDTPISSADAIYAFLNGNSQALAAQPKTVLKVDDQTLDTSEATAGIGYVKTAMSGDGKQTFSADKTSSGTSWGAVYLQFMQPTSDIIDLQSGISVKREFLSAEANSLLFTHHSSLKVGDRIKVRITITADRDYDFVEVIDKRAACMEPVKQLSGYGWGYYCTPKDCSTNYYFDLLSKGKHVIETEYYIDRAGTYETGTCTASCAYSPEFRGTAKSQTLEVK